MDTKTKIERVLDKYVRPSLREHGGDIQMNDFVDGKLYVSYLGACRGCPSVDITTQDLVNKEVLSRVDEVEEVILESYVDDSIMDMAMRILKGERP